MPDQSEAPIVRDDAEWLRKQAALIRRARSEGIVQIEASEKGAKRLEHIAEIIRLCEETLGYVDRELDGLPQAMREVGTYRRTADALDELLGVVRTTLTQIKGQNP